MTRVKSIAEQGFSLIELMIVLVLMGIFLGMAVPAYQEMIIRNRVIVNANALKVDIEYARSIATKQGLNAILCPSTDGINCTGGTDWAVGWIAFASAGACTATVGITTLKQKDGLKQSDTASYTPNSVGNNSVCFNRMGYASAAYTGKFEFNATPSANAFRACVILFGAGQTEVLRYGETGISAVSC